VKYLNDKKIRGFTLVELLVVIAIIGILSSVVIASLLFARQRAANSAIKTNLTTIRASAELLFDNNGYSYGLIGRALAPCPVVIDTTVFGQNPIFSAINSALTASGTGGTATCVSSPLTVPITSWAVSVRLNAPENIGGVIYNYWCVDYLSNSKGQVSDLSGSQTFCQ